MNAIKETKNAIVLENSFVKIELSNKDASVISVTDKRDSKSIMAEEKTYFFAHFDAEKNAFSNKALTLNGNVLTLETEKGKTDFSIDVADDHFVIEVVSKKLPDGVDFVRFADMKFDYDFEEKDVLVAAGVVMTVNTHTNYFPRGIDKALMAEGYDRLGGSFGARYGFTVVPRKILRDGLKNICSKIDPEKGIVSNNAGAWARDSRVAFGSYLIDANAHPDHVRESIPFWKTLGVDQIDFHQGGSSVIQGSFRYAYAKDHEEFRRTVTDPLKENGLGAGLHTYAFYVHPLCTEILSDPKWQKQIETNEVFTLKEDITAETDYIYTEESTADMETYYGFFTKNIPYVLIGEEIVKFANVPDGFKVVERGAVGTKAVAHKKGEKVIHLVGYFGEFAPVIDSDLYYYVAHATAETYNKGGFCMIYEDAIDGLGRHCPREDRWYYGARFAHEIVKNCEIPPIIEFSDFYPELWAARARQGATDLPYRAYKNWNREHHKGLKTGGTLNHYASTLGWYNYYPTTDNYPGNQHTKYQHWDAIDHMGALSVIHDYSTVHNGTNPAAIPRVRALRRNIELYNMYSKLRQSFYFKEELLERLRENDDQEYKIIKKDNGKYVFVEKKYDVKRLYSILEEGRNTAEFENPYKKQTPFVRIEHCMSTLGQEEMILLPMNENAPVASQLKGFDFGGEINLTQKLAMKVRVKGNGKKGHVAIKTYAATNSEKGYGLYIIDTDFEGWRDFVLLEADNGDRVELGFDVPKPNIYAVYRSGLDMGRITRVELHTAGDVEGVQMSSVTACRQTYNVWKNPTVKIGDESVMFECELMSTDFIEYDGNEAKVIDRYGNEKPIWHTGSITAPKGRVKASLGGVSLNACPINAYLTLGFTGKEVK